MSRLRLATPVLLVLGVALMVPFKSTIPLALGIACMFAFVVCGVFLIATPAFLEHDEPDSS
jgi:hypothetical protein